MSSHHEKKNAPVGGRTGRPKTAARLSLESLEDRSLLNGTSISPAAVTVSNPQAYVTALYADLLGRQVEATALNQDSARLGTGHYSAQQEVTRIINSPEFAGVLSRSIYNDYLNSTDFTTADVNSGAAFLGSKGGSARGLVQQILASDSYYKNVGGNTNAGYVDALYLDILNRARVGTDGQGFVTLLNNGASHKSIVQQIANTTEGKNGLATNEVDEIYEALLNRGSRNEALAVPYANALASGRATEAQVLTAVATSPEFVASTGGKLIPLKGFKATVPLTPIVPADNLNDAANRKYVTSLYLHLLTRFPEADALTFYANQLDGAKTPFQVSQARIKVSTEIVNSTEFHQTTINRATVILLGRPATQAELSNTASFENQAIAFLSSDAYFNSAAGGGGTNAGYLNSLYTLILGRTGANPAGSDPGSTFYLNELNNHVARSTVVTQLVDSPEGSNHVGTTVVNTVYELLLNRTAIGDPKATPWINTLGRSLTVNQLVINIVSGPEFYGDAQNVVFI